MNLPKKVFIKEVGPRDGFQMEKQITPTEKKIEIINLLSECGFEDIQASSFMHPKAIPNLADAEEVFSKINKKSDIYYTAVIANRKGYERAVAAGLKKVEYTLSTTDSHCVNNTNKTTEEALAMIRECCELRLETEITGGCAVVFGCPFEGRPPMSRIRWLIDNLVDMGITEVVLGDSSGNGDPKQVSEVFDMVMNAHPNVTFAYHPHNTWGMAMANCLAAMDAGVTNFDASVSGIGGCPFLPGASGNIATEDFVQMLHMMGIETGLDLDKIIEAAKLTRAAVSPGHGDSNILRTGRKATDIALEKAQHQQNK